MSSKQQELNTCFCVWVVPRMKTCVECGPINPRTTSYGGSDEHSLIPALQLVPQVMTTSSAEPLNRIRHRLNWPACWLVQARLFEVFFFSFFSSASLALWNRTVNVFVPSSLHSSAVILDGSSYWKELEWHFECILDHRRSIGEKNNFS